MREQELRGCVEERVSRNKYTGFHCEVLQNADLALIRAMLHAAPEVVAVRDSTHLHRSSDAVQLALKVSAPPEVVAEMVVRCLQATGIAPDGWHSILESNEYSKYVAAVVAFVQQEAADHLQLQRVCSSTSLGRRRHQRHTTPEHCPAQHGTSRAQPIRHSAAIAQQLTSPEQEAVYQLASALDSMHRRAIDLATPENKKSLEDASLYLKRCKNSIRA